MVCVAIVTLTNAALCELLATSTTHVPIEFLCFKTTLSPFISFHHSRHIIANTQDLVHARAHESLVKLVFLYYFIFFRHCSRNEQLSLEAAVHPKSSTIAVTQSGDEERFFPPHLPREAFASGS